MTSEPNKQKIAKIYDIFPAATKDQIAKILQYYDDDENKAMDALTRDGGSEALSNWAESGSLKSKNNKNKKKKKKGRKDTDFGSSATASFDADDSSSLHSSGNVDAEVEKECSVAENRNGILPGSVEETKATSHERLNTPDIDALSSLAKDLTISKSDSNENVDTCIPEDMKYASDEAENPTCVSPVSDSSEKHGESNYRRDRYRSVKDEGHGKHSSRQRTNSFRRYETTSLSEDSSSIHNAPSAANPTKRGNCKEFSCIRMKDSSSSSGSDYSEVPVNTEESDWLTMTSVTEESYTSISDDSLGLLTEDQLDSAWYSDSESEDLFPNFKKFDPVSGFEFPQNFSWPISNKNEGREISPICAQERSSIDRSTLESTPRIERSIQKESKKSFTRYKDDILNKTVKISSVCDDSLKETFTAVKSNEEPNLEHNMLNITCHIESEEKKETSLNRTFGTLNILNKTLPSVFSTTESPSYLTSEENEEIEKKVRNKTFTESPKYRIVETRSYSCDTKRYKLPVQPENSQKMLSRTVTNIKNKKNKNSTENSWNTLNSSISLYPQSSVSETDLSQTGTKKKTFKIDRGIQKIKKNSSNSDVKSQSVRNRTRSVLSTSNRDLKRGGDDDRDSSSAFVSLGDIDPEIPPHNITTIPRGNKPHLPKKAPINLSFKTIDKQPPSQKEIEKLRIEEIYLKNEDYIKKKYRESAKLVGFPDYKLSLYGCVKEIEKVRRRRDFRSADIPTVSLVEEPFTEQRIFSRSPHASPSQGRSFQISRPSCRSSHLPRATERFSESYRVPFRSSGITRPQCRQQGRRPVLPLPSREPAHLTPQRMPDNTQMRSSRRNSRIPTLGQRAFGPQAIFGTNPFDPPVRGRMSSVTRETPEEPPFQK